jgi:Beta-lactamase superfamily domain
MDPVFFDPFEAGANVSYPRRTVDVHRVPPVDLIILSHRHFDHYDLRTLALFNRNIPCIIPRNDEVIHRGLHLLGYTHIRAVPPGAKIRLGATTVVTTPSRVPFPEMGVIIQDDTATVWNCVDSVIDQSIVTEFSAIMGTIDCVLATYNPLIQFELRSQFQQLFPFERYKMLVENVVASKPRVIVPSACGLRYPVGAWQNHLGFPMTPERFIQDVKQMNPAIAGVQLLPGDCLVLDHDENKHIQGATPFVACNRSEASSCAAWTPDPAIGIEPFADKNPLGHPVKAIKTRAQRYIEDRLLRDLQSEQCRHLLENLKRWRVCWQLDLYIPSLPQTQSQQKRRTSDARLADEQATCPLDSTVTCEILAAVRSARSRHSTPGPSQSWFLDFSETPLRWHTIPLSFINLHTAVAASGIVDALEGNITFYSFNFTDRYRYSRRTYLTQPEGITSPKQQLEEPLSSVLAKCHDVDLRYVEKQVAYWQEHDPITGEKKIASLEKL